MLVYGKNIKYAIDEKNLQSTQLRSSQNEALAIPAEIQPIPQHNKKHSVVAPLPVRKTAPQLFYCWHEQPLSRILYREQQPDIKITTILYDSATGQDGFLLRVEAHLHVTTNRATERGLLQANIKTLKKFKLCGWYSPFYMLPEAISAPRLAAINSHTAYMLPIAKQRARKTIGSVTRWTTILDRLQCNIEVQASQLDHPSQNQNSRHKVNVLMPKNMDPSIIFPSEDNTNTRTTQRTLSNVFFALDSAHSTLAHSQMGAGSSGSNQKKNKRT